MGSTNQTIAVQANQAVAQACIKNAKNCTVIERVVAVLKDIWPRKTAENVAFVTGLQKRAVGYWLAAHTGMKLEHAARLLDTEDGYEILEAIMGDSQEEWWVATKIAHEVHTTRRAIKREMARLTESKKKLDALDI